MLAAIDRLADGECALVKGTRLLMLRGFVVSVTDGVKQFAKRPVICAACGLPDFQGTFVEFACLGMVARWFRVLNGTAIRFREIFER